MCIRDKQNAAVLLLLQQGGLHHALQADPLVTPRHLILDVFGAVSYTHLLTFVAPVDLSTRMLSELCSQIAPELVPVASAAAAILQDLSLIHI